MLPRRACCGCRQAGRLECQSACTDKDIGFRPCLLMLLYPLLAYTLEYSTDRRGHHWTLQMSPATYRHATGTHPLAHTGRRSVAHPPECVVAYLSAVDQHHVDGLPSASCRDKVTTQRRPCHIRACMQRRRRKVPLFAAVDFSRSRSHCSLVTGSGHSESLQMITAVATAIYIQHYIYSNICSRQRFTARRSTHSLCEIMPQRWAARPPLPAQNSTKTVPPFAAAAAASRGGGGSGCTGCCGGCGGGPALSGRQGALSGRCGGALLLAAACAQRRLSRYASMVRCISSYIHHRWPVVQRRSYRTALHRTAPAWHGLAWLATQSVTCIACICRSSGDCAAYSLRRRSC